MVLNNLSPDAPIGVFDSGLGGLTVLKSLQKQMPRESFLYFGDTAHVPYGTRSDKTVIQYSTAIVQFLVEKRVKLIVIACNTASAIALETLQSSFDIPIFGVVEPVVEKVFRNYQGGFIGIIGTRATISSHAYSAAFNKLDNSIRTIEKACPLFVPIIEEGWAETPIAAQIAKIYLSEFDKVPLRSLVLGCTHYPIISKTISNILPKSVNLFSSGEAVGEQVDIFLAKNRLQNTGAAAAEHFYITDFPQQFEIIGSRFLGREFPKIEQVSIFS